MRHIDPIAADGDMGRPEWRAPKQRTRRYVRIPSRDWPNRSPNRHPGGCSPPSRPGEFAERALSELARAIPAKANGSERYVLLGDAAGNLVAAVPSLSGDLAQNVPEILRDGRAPPRIRTGAAEITLPDGTPVLLT